MQSYLKIRLTRLDSTPVFLFKTNQSDLKDAIEVTSFNILYKIRISAPKHTTATY